MKQFKVKLLGMQLQVILLPHKKMQKWADKGEVLWGYFDGDARKIYLSNKMDQARRKRILMHELVHAVFYITGITNMLDDKLEETICDAMENLTNVGRLGI